MDEKTSVLVCLGAAVSANCVTCFQHYHGEALRVGLDAAAIEAAAALGAKVKAGANIAVMSAVTEALRAARPQEPDAGCTASAGASCCSRNG